MKELDLSKYPTMVMIGVPVTIDLSTGETTVADAGITLRQVRERLDAYWNEQATDEAPWIIEWFLPPKNRDPGDAEWMGINEHWVPIPVTLDTAMSRMERAAAMGGIWRVRNLKTGQIVLHGSGDKRL